MAGTNGRGRAGMETRFRFTGAPPTATIARLTNECPQVATAWSRIHALFDLLGQPAVVDAPSAAYKVLTSVALDEVGLRQPQRQLRVGASSMQRRLPELPLVFRPGDAELTLKVTLGPPERGASARPWPCAQ